MATALETIVKQLEDSGIVAAGKLKDFVPPKAHPKSVEELVAELVKQNHLTKFQAQQVSQGKSKALILGNYTILDKIGAGGMGQVFKAEHRRMERLVAIKMLPPAMTKDAAAVARFQREVKAAAKLRHPNIVAADDADEANGAHFLVMEYIEGKDLSALVKKNGPFPVAKAVNYILQAARALEFAHSEGVIHRDIKPANLLLDKKGVVKILDMGLARIDGGSNAPAQAELTGTGAMMGTVDYMAPEQAMSTRDADARADIYSLGCSLHYLIAGKATYGGESVIEKLLAHREKPIPNLRDVSSDVSAELEAVFEKMVAKTIEDRYQTMTEVVADLEKCSSGQATSLSIQQSSSTNLANSALTFMPNIQVAPTIQKTRVTKPAAAAESSAGKPPPWKNTKVLIGAGAAGFLVLLLGVWVIIRDKNGKLVAKAEVPDGGSVKVQEVKNSPFGKPAKKAEAVVKADSPAKIGSGTIPPLAKAPFDAAQAKAHQEAWANYLGMQFETTNSVGAKMMLIPPGEFLMGSTDEDVEKFNAGKDEQPQHRVVITRPLLMGATEVTVGEFKKSVAATGYKTEAEKAAHDAEAKTYLNPGCVATDDMPVTHISWNDAVAYCRWLSEQEKATYRLPTEAEWEYACRAGTTTPYSFGADSRGIQKYGWYKDNVTPNGTLGPAGKQLPNPFGLHDVHGNVFEWCQDYYDEKWYEKSPLNDPAGPESGSRRVLRGGYSSYSGPTWRSAYRNAGASTSSSKGKGINWMGFRVVRVLDSSATLTAGVPTSLTTSAPVTTASVTPQPSVTTKPAGFALDFSPEKKSHVVVPGWKYDGKTPLTAECWVVQRQATESVISILSCTQSGGWSIRCDASGLRFMLHGKQKDYVTVQSDAPLQLKRPTHIAAVFNGRECSLYIDGRRQKERQSIDPPYVASDVPLLVGAEPGKTRSADTEFFDGTIDEVRISTVARYSADFTPQARFLPDKDTLLLYHFDEGTGTIAKDSSTNKRKGQINGATWVAATVSPQSPIPNSTLSDPAFQQWMKDVTAMPADKQIEAVAKKLMELNPGFDGKLTNINESGPPNVEDGMVTELRFHSLHVTDISPLRAFSKLNTLICYPGGNAGSQLSDLSPLRGAPLVELRFSGTSVSDLSPLKGMPLRTVQCDHTHVSNLLPLEDCKTLTTLNATKTKVTPASIAALQKALPDCKIDWEGAISASPVGEGAKPKTPQSAASGTK